MEEIQKREAIHAGATKIRGKSNLKGQRPEIFVAKTYIIYQTKGSETRNMVIGIILNFILRVSDP